MQSVSGAVASAPTARRWRLARWGGLPGSKFLAALSILLLWFVASATLPKGIVPAPAAVGATMVQLVASGEAWGHVGQTLGRIGGGFALACVLGLAVGLAMGFGPRVAQYLELWVTFISTIPSLCWGLIGLAWFGLRNQAAFFTIVAVVFPLVAINFWSGVKSIDMSLVEMGRAFRAPRSLIIRQVVIPQLVPYAFAAIRSGLPMAWKIAIIVEMLGLSNGVGYRLTYWFHLLNMTQVFAWTLLFTAVMLAFEYAIIQPLERASLRWKQEVRI